MEVGSSLWFLKNKKLPDKIDIFLKGKDTCAIYYFSGSFNNQYFSTNIEMRVEILEKSGKVIIKNDLSDVYHTAILYTPNTRNNIRWSTLHIMKDFLFYPPLVKYMIDGGILKELLTDSWKYELNDLGKQIFNNHTNLHLGGLINLQIKWIPNSIPFRIVNKGSYESIEIFDPKEWTKC